MEGISDQGHPTQLNITTKAIKAMVSNSDIITASAYKEWRSVDLCTMKVFVKDVFATVQEIYADIPDDIMFNKEGQALPSITINSANVTAFITSQQVPGSATHIHPQERHDAHDHSTASFRSAMGLDILHSALLVAEILEHKAKV